MQLATSTGSDMAHSESSEMRSIGSPVVDRFVSTCRLDLRVLFGMTAADGGAEGSRPLRGVALR